MQHQHSQAAVVVRQIRAVQPRGGPPMTHHIAFLGTGIMGAPMAANLIKAGFTAAVWNRTRSKTEPLAVQGARVANQIMVACNIASVAQGLLFACAGGADPAQIPVALAGGHADSRVDRKS